MKPKAMSKPVTDSNTHKLILGIETSCDESAAAVVRDDNCVLSNVIASQHDLHETYGGVVPEIASRAHVDAIIPVIDQALSEANVTLDDIDAIAVGNRPGLIGSLIVGISAAKALALATGKPLLGIDHVHAHLHAPHLHTESNTTSNNRPNTNLGANLGLVVSGGHTTLYLLTPNPTPNPETNTTHYQPLGRTIDDAIGEAYDKAAVILGIPYPGGPNLDQLAQAGNPKAYDLPRSMLKPGSLDFSFSGLKTALLYTVRGQPTGKDDRNKPTFARSHADLTEQDRADLAASFQAAAVDVIIKKIKRALQQLADPETTSPPVKPSAILIGGGVSANSELRRQLQQLGEQHDLTIALPPMPYCMDNAAMIAGAAHERFANDDFDDLNLPAIATTQMV